MNRYTVTLFHLGYAHQCTPPHAIAQHSFVPHGAGRPASIVLSKACHCHAAFGGAELGAVSAASATFSHAKLRHVARRCVMGRAIGQCLSAELGSATHAHALFGSVQDRAQTRSMRLTTAQWSFASLSWAARGALATRPMSQTIVVTQCSAAQTYVQPRAVLRGRCQARLCSARRSYVTHGDGSASTDQYSTLGNVGHCSAQPRPAPPRIRFDGSMSSLRSALQSAPRMVKLC